MVEKNPVSVNWQTLFIIIPIIDLWATYRIQKLRLYIVVNIAMLVTEFLIVILIFGEESFDYYASEQVTDIHIIFGVAVFVIETGIFIALIRKWSKEWNEKIKK